MYLYMHVCPNGKNILGLQFKSRTKDGEMGRDIVKTSIFIMRF